MKINVVRNITGSTIAALSLATVSLDAFAVTPVPEPSILGLLGIGVAAIALVKLRRK
jgi:hypothetical protein